MLSHTTTVSGANGTYKRDGQHNDFRATICWLQKTASQAKRGYLTYNEMDS